MEHSKNMSFRGENRIFPERTLLDSKHIKETFYKIYNVKVRYCGSYYQIYLYDKAKVKFSRSNKNSYDILTNKPEEITTARYTDSVPKEIEKRSIIRCKLNCQALAKANIDIWKTFITLTFEENITDIEFANKRFKNFTIKVRRVVKDFKYICIPEFQKRGAVHYHLLTNISINDKRLIFQQEDNKKFYHIKYWHEGFTSVERIKGEQKKIIGYISKYMTKDIDNRLFNHKRYFASRNIDKPFERYIDLSNSKDLEIYNKIIQESDFLYHKEYINPYDNSFVNFLELFKNE